MENVEQNKIHYTFGYCILKQLFKENIINEHQFKTAIKEIEEIVDNYIVRAIKYKDKIVFELFTGDNMEVSMSKYPKRVNSRDYVPIMDIKHRYKIDRGAVQYYEEISIEVLLVA